MVFYGQQMLNVTIQWDGLVNVQAGIKASKFSQGEFFMTGRMTSISASFEFDCLFKFLEDTSQFLIEKLTGEYEDENCVKHIDRVEQIADDEDEETSFWNYFNILFLTIFGLQEVELLW